MAGESTCRFASLTRHGRGRYQWNDFVLKPSGLTSEITGSSRARCDLGVYAARDLTAGLWLPIAGRPLGSPPVYPTNIEYCYQRNAPYQCIDGNPGFHAYNGVGCFGLALAMMVNEPGDALTHANCMFKMNFLVTTADIQKGQQLLVDYGPIYNRDYVVDRTPLVRDLEAEAHLKAIKGRVPDPKRRRAVLDAVEKAVAFELSKIPSQVNIPSRRPTLGLEPRAAAAVCAGTYLFEQALGANPTFIARSRLPLSVNVYAQKSSARERNIMMERALVPPPSPSPPPPPHTHTHTHSPQPTSRTGEHVE